jgi:hypothetical protein
MPKSRFIKVTVGGKAESGNVQGMVAVGDYVDPASGQRTILFERPVSVSKPAVRRKQGAPVAEAGKQTAFPGSTAPTA